jgi:hypothetical protein
LIAAGLAIHLAIPFRWIIGKDASTLYGIKERGVNQEANSYDRQGATAPILYDRQGATASTMHFSVLTKWSGRNGNATLAAMLPRIAPVKCFDLGAQPA